MSLVCAIVILYKPDIDLLKRNLDSFFDSVDQVLLWCNSPFDKGVIQDYGEKVILCGDESNQGISRALNYAWHFAKSNGFDYLLSMDQDSVWEGFAAYLKNIKSVDAPYGIYGPVVNGILPNIAFREVDLVITSGMIIPISLLDKLGGFDNNFFVGCVDYDICCHAKELGEKMFIVGGGRLIQQFGKTMIMKCKVLPRFLPQKSVRNYSAQRMYEGYRNSMIIIRKYKSADGFRKEFWRHQCFPNLAIIALYEKNSWPVLKAAIKGLLDGIKFKI